MSMVSWNAAKRNCKNASKVWGAFTDQWGPEFFLALQEIPTWSGVGANGLKLSSHKLFSEEGGDAGSLVPKSVEALLKDAKNCFSGTLYVGL